jgi:hypothetical protein
MARLLDPRRRGQKRFPFEYRNSATTDVRATWDRLKPGWNKPPEKRPPAVVRSIKRTA